MITVIFKQIFASPIRSGETTFFVGYVDKRRIPVIILKMITVIKAFNRELTGI